MEEDKTKHQINDWYHAYSNDIFNYIIFMNNDRDQAKDILQDTFLRAYTSFQSFDGKNAKSWLFKIARNLTIDHFRKQKPVSYLVDSLPAGRALQHDPDYMMMLNEREKQLYLVLNKMKRSHREVIVLRKIKEFSIHESAEIMGWTESRVKVTLFKALKALKTELQKEGYVHEQI